MFKNLEPSRTLPAISNSGSTAAGMMPAGTCPPGLIGDRVRILMGCYRQGEASDPDIYATAIASVFAGYPETVVRAVTDPARGLPGRSKWLPSVAEVVAACDAEQEPERRETARRAKLAETYRVIDGAAADRAARPTYAELVAANPDLFPGAKKQKEYVERVDVIENRFIAESHKPVNVSDSLVKKLHAGGT